MPTTKTAPNASGKAELPETSAFHRNTIKLSEVNKLEKRMGVRVWDGVLFNRDGITNPTLTILRNKIGEEIRQILALEQQ